MRHGRRTFVHTVPVLAILAVAAGCGSAETPQLEEADQALAGAYCSEPTFSVSRLSSGANQAVLSARSNCGAAPAEYRFSVNAPGATSSVIVRGYEPNGDFIWDFTGQPSGRHIVTVAIRPAGSTAELDATANASLYVGNYCSPVTLQTAVSGTTVELTAAATCTGGATPEYRFFAKAPGATAYTQLRAYAPGGNVSFSGAASTGRYEFIVYSRAVGNASDLEGWGSTSALVGPTCSSTTIAGRFAGGAVDLAAAATCGAVTPEYRFLVRRPGQPTFSEARPYGAEGAFQFGDLSGPGRYEFQVHARAKSNASEWEAQATTSVLVGPTCSASTLSARSDGNTLIDLTASGTCATGVSPEYRFLVRRPGAAAFVEFRPFEPDPHASFKALPMTPGRYELKVFVRAAGNASDYESLSVASVLVGPTCSGATLVAGLDGSGAVMKLVAGAACPVLPGEYRFLARVPGATAFSEIQPYGPASTYTFPAPNLSGRFEFQVQVRSPGNMSDYDTVATVSAQIGSTCTVTTLTPSFDGYQGVEVTASASCGGATPEYRFFVRRPGEPAFTQFRPYALYPQASYVIDPPLPGRYDFQVFARVAGNASDWEAAATSSIFAGPTCSVAALGARFDGVGMVDLTGSSSCTFNAMAEYRFMVRRPGETAFVEFRPYGTSSSTQYWMQQVPTPGRYEFQVHVRAQGSTSGYEAIASAAALVGITCSSATLVANEGTFATEVGLRASAVCGGGVPEYRFLVRRPGSPSFTQVRSWGTSPDADYDSAPAAPGKYDFQVQVRTQGNASDYETTASASYSFGGTCTSASLNALQDPGGVQLAAGALCTMDRTAEYRFLARRPGDVGFGEVRPWGAEPNLLYFPYPWSPGRYEFQVQVRAAGNASDAEAAASAASLLGPVCGGAGIVARVDGYSVSLFANASCTYTGQPEYRFQVKRPGEAAFVDFRPYALDSFAFYLPNQLPRGRYEFQVLVRMAGNASAWEAAAKTAVFVGDACSSAGLTATRAPGSNTVELAAMGSCGFVAMPEYRFLVKGPGESAFSEVRPYGFASGFAFDVGSRPMGRYDFQVWVRAAGNASEWEAQASAVTFIGFACSVSALAATFDPITGPAVDLGASAACRMGTPEFRFLVRAPGATAFREFRPYGPEPRTPFYEGLPPARGRYEFQVAVRAAGNASDETTATTSLLIDRSCGGVVLSATPDGGPWLNLFAAAACQYWGYPEYRFLVRQPGSASFVELRPYASDPSFHFLAPESGRYELQVQARAKENASDWEAQATIGSLVGATCRTAVLTSVSAPPTFVHLIAGSSCLGAVAEYRFMYRPVGAAAFTELRPYGGASELDWNTAALPFGKYEVVVQTRVAGNQSVYEASATLVVPLEP